MKSSNAAIDQTFDNKRPTARSKPQLRSVSTSRAPKISTPRLNREEALQEAMRRTG